MGCRRVLAHVPLPQRASPQRSMEHIVPWPRTHARPVPEIEECRRRRAECTSRGVRTPAEDVDRGRADRTSSVCAGRCAQRRRCQHPTRCVRARDVPTPRDVRTPRDACTPRDA